MSHVVALHGTGVNASIHVCVSKSPGVLTSIGIREAWEAGIAVDGVSIVQLELAISVGLLPVVVVA